MMFPKTMSVVPLAEPNMLTISSGNDVPNATIVNPMTSVDIPSFLARDDAPSTK